MVSDFLKTALLGVALLTLGEPTLSNPQTSQPRTVGAHRKKSCIFQDSDTFLIGVHIVIQTGSPIIYELWDHVV